MAIVSNSDTTAATVPFECSILEMLQLLSSHFRLVPKTGTPFFDFTAHQCAHVESVALQ
jgi:hypothetical protein